MISKKELKDEKRDREPRVGVVSFPGFSRPTGLLATRHLKKHDKLI